MLLRGLLLVLVIFCHSASFAQDYFFQRLETPRVSLTWARPGVVGAMGLAPNTNRFLLQEKFLPETDISFSHGLIRAEESVNGTDSVIRGRTDFRILGTVYRKVRYQNSRNFISYRFVPVRLLLTADSLNPGIQLRNLQLGAIALQKSILSSTFLRGVNLQASALNYDRSLYGQNHAYATPIGRMDIASIHLSSLGLDRASGDGSLILDIQYTLPATWVWMDDAITKMNDYAQSMGTPEMEIANGNPGWMRADESRKTSTTYGIRQDWLEFTINWSTWGFVKNLETEHGTATLNQAGALRAWNLGLELSEMVPGLKPYGDFELRFSNQLQRQIIRAKVLVEDATGSTTYYNSLQDELWSRKAFTIVWTMANEFPKSRIRTPAPGEAQP
jgi:hypothetical protein